MTFRVILLPRAEQDIEANARWWAEKHSVEQAVRWFDTIHEQLSSLSFLPESNSVSAENDEFPYEIRDKLLGVGSRPSYRGIFTIIDDVVYLLTVRRASQDAVHPNEIQRPPNAALE